MMANRVREDTSRRASVRRSRPRVSRTNQCARCLARTASTASTLSMSPRVFSCQVPISSSLVRSMRIASSSSRAICSGHQATPAARMPSIASGCACLGPETVSVAVRAARSMTASTYS